MKKVIVNAQLMQATPMSKSKTKNNHDCGLLDYGTESVVIVNAKALFKFFGHKTDFVALNRPIGETYLHPTRF